MKKFFAHVFRLLPFLLCAAVISALFFWPEEGKAEEERRVVTVWNIDTFEGGRGSRTSYLKKAALALQKKRKGVYFLISSYTAEGAEAAFNAGVKPDALSFGIGFSLYAEESLALPYEFAGGMLGGACRAYPWCRGKYFLFSLKDDFGEEGETALSAGGSNLTALSAVCAGIEGEERESLAAYSGFLGGSYRYLLGTQRDECRFRTRGTAVYSRELTAFCDLYQYFSVLSEEHFGDCLALLEELLSQKTQEGLSEIGMYPVNGGSAERTLSVFTDGETLKTIHDRALGGADGNFPDKYLKSI